MITGLIVWNDGNVIVEWVSYFMVHLIMLLGISLLAPADVVEKFGIKKRTETFTSNQVVERLSRVLLSEADVSSPSVGPSLRVSQVRNSARTTKRAHEIVSESRAPTLLSVLLKDDLMREIDAVRELPTKRAAVNAIMHDLDEEDSQESKSVEDSVLERVSAVNAAHSNIQVKDRV